MVAIKRALLSSINYMTMHADFANTDMEASRAHLWVWRHLIATAQRRWRLLTTSYTGLLTTKRTATICDKTVYIRRHPGVAQLHSISKMPCLTWCTHKSVISSEMYAYSLAEASIARGHEYVLDRM